MAQKQAVTAYRKLPVFHKYYLSFTIMCYMLLVCLS